MTTLALIAVIAALIFGLSWLASMWARAGSKLEAQADASRHDADLAKKQGEAMAEHRTVEDAADRLDSGSF